MSLEIRRYVKDATSNLVCDAHRQPCTHQIIAHRPDALTEVRERKVMWLDVCGRCLSEIARRAPRRRAKKGRRA